ncbi:D-amino-acid transaminase [Euryhalocaulis caribicus]|uniref:D-amino-acid transaminase n=1 Tax=Euryhalocaulis caribicus TaxID=1161401 RepID=UPI00039B4A5E|nr:D-amino-acid transaminase [Euryhalocaulis caribicus]
MPRIAYVDGAFTPHRDACVGIEDRGLQFADSVYEVWGVRNGRLMDSPGHLDRLFRSLGELRIAFPVTREALMIALEELRRRNRIRNGLLYLQVTRGVAPRDHGFPVQATPTVIATAKHIPQHKADARAKAGVSVVTAPDIRWGRCDIKTTGLTANILAKQHAREQGAFEVWMLDADGYVTEGSSSNAWIVASGGVLVTRPVTDNILAGVTRAAILRIASELGLTVEERAFTPQEAMDAKEAFMTSASSFVMPVISIDGAQISAGRPGETSVALRQGYEKLALNA